MANMSKHAFNRQESWRYKRVKPAWRRARGVTSKIRKEEAGWPPKVKVGYGTAAATRGLHPRGLQERLIHRLSELEELDPKIHIVRISARVGERKRLTLLDELRQRNFHIANPGKEEERPVTPEEPTAPIEIWPTKESWQPQGRAESRQGSLGLEDQSDPTTSSVLERQETIGSSQLQASLGHVEGRGVPKPFSRR